MHSENVPVSLLVARWICSIGIFFGLCDRRATSAFRAASHRRHPIRIRILGQRRSFLPQQTAQKIEDYLESRAFFLSIRHTPSYSNSESTNSLGSNGSRSPTFSPTPTNRTGSPNSREMATTTPPFA